MLWPIALRETMSAMHLRMLNLCLLSMSTNKSSRPMGRGLLFPLIKYVNGFIGKKIDGFQRLVIVS